MDEVKEMVERTNELLKAMSEVDYYPTLAEE
jgi:hypothetical protein